MLEEETSNGQIPTMDEVMEDLQQATRQYLSCPDPVEAAARRQRVLHGDAMGQMEETAAAIIAAETRRQSNTPQTRGLISNPNTPPPYQNMTLNDRPLHETSDRNNPQAIEEEEGRLDQYHKNAETTPKRASEAPAKLKSIIISPEADPKDINEEVKEVPEAQLNEETLLEFQNKIKRKPKRSQGPSKARNSPNILRGASPRKRLIAQIQNSPSQARGTRSGTSSKGRKRSNIPSSDPEPTQNSMNPPIQLIPAMNRKKSDFWASPLQAP